MGAAALRRREDAGLHHVVIVALHSGSGPQGPHSPGGPEYHVTGPVRPLPVAPVGPYVCALYGDFSYLVFRRLKNLRALPGTWVQLHF